MTACCPATPSSSPATASRRSGRRKPTAVPEGATRVDGRGKYLMPGLAEMHGHIPPPTRAARTRRQRAVPLRRHRRHHRPRHAGRARPARTAGGGEARRDRRAEPLSRRPAVQRQRGQVGRGCGRARPPAEIRRLGPAEGSGGAGADVYDAMAKTAKEVGIRFGGHVPDDVDVMHALDMGQETFDHIDGYIEHLDGRAKPSTTRRCRISCSGRRKAGAWIVPTMVVWETLQGPVTLESRTGLPELQYMPASTGRRSGRRRSRPRLKNPQFNARAGEAAHRQPDAHPEGAARRRRAGCCSAATRRSSSTCPASRSTAR